MVHISANYEELGISLDDQSRINLRTVGEFGRY